MFHKFFGNVREEAFFLLFCFDEDAACCFTGHRQIPGDRAEALAQKVCQTVQNLYLDRGYNIFLCGGAIGFDQLAAEAVLRAREAFPAIRLYLCLPFHGHDAAWSPTQRSAFEKVRLAADAYTYLSEAYAEGVYHKRDRIMVNLSSLCVAYLNKRSGGTYYTVSYAYDRGREIINLAKTI